MADHQQKIDVLEIAAIDCDLISQLAVGEDERRLNTGLSEKYHDAANDLKHPRLRASEERVEAGQKLVARQRGIVARLARQGHPTMRARQLLSVLADTLGLLEKQRDIYRQLGS